MRSSVSRRSDSWWKAQSVWTSRSNGPCPHRCIRPCKNHHRTAPPRPRTSCRLRTTAAPCYPPARPRPGVRAAAVARPKPPAFCSSPCPGHGHVRLVSHLDHPRLHDAGRLGHAHGHRGSHARHRHHAPSHHRWSTRCCCCSCCCCSTTPPPLRRSTLASASPLAVPWCIYRRTRW